MPMDAYRVGDEFVVAFDLPGVSPDAIELDVERNVLTVKAERRPVATGTEHVEMQVAERPLGVFSRQLFLGDTLDSERISAHYDAGVLTLRIPSPRRRSRARSRSRTPRTRTSRSTPDPERWGRPHRPHPVAQECDRGHFVFPRRRPRRPRPAGARVRGDRGGELPAAVRRAGPHTSAGAARCGHPAPVRTTHRLRASALQSVVRRGRGATTTRAAARAARRGSVGLT